MKQYVVERNQQQTIMLTKPGEYEVVLAGEGAEVLIRGRFSAQQTDRIAVSLVIKHQAQHTKSETMLKGLATDCAFLKFTGRIVIDENCGDTQAFLTERILLLSDTARAETVPDLEIKTDDVKCSHAASIASIPEEQLFYLESRGIAPAQAKELIAQGFLAS